MPPHIVQASARWQRLAARNQARRLPLYRPKGWQAGEALQPPGQRSDQAVYPDRGGSDAAQGAELIEGEAVACGPDGIALFDLIRYRRHDERVFLRAFDIIELNGDDLRLETLVSRKATLAIALAGAGAGIEINDHLVPGIIID